MNQESASTLRQDETAGVETIVVSSTNTEMVRNRLSDKKNKQDNPPIANVGTFTKL